MMSKNKKPFWISSNYFSDKRGALHKFLDFKKIKKLKFKVIEAQISEYNKNVFRGFYAQVGKYKECKLIQILEGSVIWFVIDIKKNKNFGKVSIYKLKKNKALFVPKDYAHGSFSLKKSKVLVLANNSYNKKFHLGINFKDINIFKQIKKYLKKKIIISKWHQSFDPLIK
tara:strand:- start:5614 stop:6123 length:510 start_codon:yes stop_codon:yes gene_type:complete